MIRAGAYDRRRICHAVPDRHPRRDVSAGAADSDLAVLRLDPDGVSNLVLAAARIFLFPYTTLCYMWAANATGYRIEGAWVFLIVIGVLLDLGSHGSARRKRRRRGR
jgi:hypothetical protein